MNNLYCLNTSRKRLREKKKGKRQEGGRKQSVERRGDDASCHEVSLVTAVTEKATDNRDYNYSFQQKETKRKRQGCDSVFFGCASLH